MKAWENNGEFEEIINQSSHSTGTGGQDGAFREI